MENQVSFTPVYSYQKFKELADDRMSQVKIFIQNSENWESAGSGTLQFYQIDSGKNSSENMMREVKSAEDYNADLNNFYLIIDGPENMEVNPQEKKTQENNADVFFSKKINPNTIIVFYDIFEGNNFEYDIESYLRRESHQLDPL